MATIVERRRRDRVGYQVRWRQDGTWQSDTFGTERQALRFQCDVADAGKPVAGGLGPGLRLRRRSGPARRDLVLVGGRALIC